jgi:hypothetical protein
MRLLFELILIYLAVGFGSEFINTGKKLVFDMQSVWAVITWPKYLSKSGTK